MPLATDLYPAIVALEPWRSQTLANQLILNPVVNTVYCDTGALTAGFYDLCFFVGTGVALAIDNLYFQWRNSANDANQWYIAIFSPGADTKHFKIQGVKVSESERFRFYCAAAYAGWLNLGIIPVKRSLWNY